MMHRNESQFGLLEYLSFQAGCMYLSDLHQPMYRLYIRHALRGLSAELFSLKDWNDAAVYITGQDRSFDTKEQAQQFLLDSISLESKTNTQSVEKTANIF